MKILLNEKTQSAYVKRLTVTHEGQDYYVTVYWNMFDGYEIDFYNSEWKMIDTPEWATEWEDTHDQSLAFYLDEESEGE